MDETILTTAPGACGPWDASVGDFPRRPGENGDSARIMRAVAAAGIGCEVYSWRTSAEGAYTIRFDALPTPRVLSFRTPLEQA